MSAFIVPMANLPTVSSVSDVQRQQATQGASKGGVPFADLLQDAVANMNGATQTSQETMLDLAVGGSDDMHTGAIASIKSSAAVNYTSSLVSAAIRSYNELMRMQL